MLKYYFDLLSQPSRAVWIFLRMNNIPHIPCPVALRKDSVEDVVDWLVVANSVAILRYLCREFPVAEHWYPRNSCTQARVDEYMAWQHANTRLNCAMFFQAKWLNPTITGEPANEEDIQRFQQGMEKVLTELETVWLKDRHFISTDNDISLADLLAVCELEQPSIAGYDVYEGRPKLNDWGERVKARLNPYFGEAHTIVFRWKEKFSGKPPSKL
ncbi:unnamed protein product [Darwinula stevensoni]|uniref:glutathione transferase n=1 Tax=Darwinula stevensoni TaxID=69355 RepID=A0A7R9A0P0_9CRUS|nr:unnamed protein product [Darwinula stevensoni]CAG0881625.1 unnamed protein product [Darwinula stevensoni]